MNNIYNVIILLIQLIHIIYIVLITISIPMLIINEPFWIWVPVNGWLVHHISSINKSDCPLTHLENIIRKKANKSTVNPFTESILERIKGITNGNR